MASNYQKETERLKKAALDWCNERRAEQDKPPIAELPKGIPVDPKSCPCGKATGLHVGTHVYYRGSEHTPNILPTDVTRFIIAFDAAQIPELIE